MQKAIILSGPTASGKTDLAYSVAQNIPAILINSDSRQVYKGLDIISGKDIPNDSVFKIDERFTQKIRYYELNNTRMYLMDLIEPSMEFSVQSYCKIVREILPIITKGCTPVFVGGSNFYIASLLNEIETAEIPPNPTLRKEMAEYSVNQLRNKLHDVNKKRLFAMNDSDGKNPRRLIRAIEIGVYQEKNHITVADPILANYEVLHIGLTAPLEYLRRKIDARVDARIAQGAIKEAECLFEKFEALATNVKTANGYTQLFSYFSGEISYEESIQRWKFSEYHNAKKQLTWIHGDSNIMKYSITDLHFSATLIHDVLHFISS